MNRSEMTRRANIEKAKLGGLTEMEKSADKEASEARAKAPKKKAAKKKSNG